MDPRIEQSRALTRRQLFGRSALGLGSAALASLLAEDSALASPSVGERFGGLDGVPHFAPKAKRVIYLLQNGAPPHVDMFDYKPMLERLRGTQIPDSVHRNQRLSTMTMGQRSKLVLPSIAPFRRRGDCGAWVSDYLPHTASIVDDIAFIRSMHTTQVNHAPAITFFLTGSEMPGRPSLGSWLSYGLGTETQDLPSFVVMTSRDKEATCGQIFYDFYWSSGFLPSRFQGVKFRAGSEPVLYTSNPGGVTAEVRRGQLDDLSRLNELRYRELADPEILTRIAQYEMSYRMQTSVPELVDLSSEPRHVLDMYGPDVLRPGSYAQNCLVARRLIERGTRYVQLFHAGWDHHNNLSRQFKIQCQDTDQPSAALVKDLRNRGLLDDTLVVWSGEFGRTPFCQGDFNNRARWGRDHHPYAFTNWMAGGGVRGGVTIGETDDFAFNVTKDPVHVHDFQATILHLLGIDHERLTFKFRGRRFRLTDVHGEVVRDLLA